jgi:hypothetical protein
MRGATRDAEFSEYVAGRRPQLRRTAYLLCGESHRAEDLVQTTLMKVYVAGPRIRRDGNVDAYAGTADADPVAQQSRPAARDVIPDVEQVRVLAVGERLELLGQVGVVHPRCLSP